jgi:hypothetical protein
VFTFSLKVATTGVVILKIKKSMAYSNISATLPAADLTAIKAAITNINQKMPFLVNLSEEDKKKLFKFGARSVDFVNDAALATQNYPSIFPSSFNVQEFQKDNALTQNLIEVKLLLDSLCEKVNDTLIAVGSEALGEALDVYAYVQRASETDQPGLKTVASKLKERFKGQGKIKKGS